jgi:hypothetical protein
MEGDMETLRERANRWIDSNPDAMRHFAGFAEQLRSLGRMFGIGLLAERVRWEMTLRGGDEDFKINNNYRAYIARRLIADDPRLVAHMRFRVTKAANLPAKEVVTAAEVNPLGGWCR